MSNKQKACTCPSGDGSLRWPCPTHQPAAAALPACDCTTTCGDDDRVGKGTAQPCTSHLNWERRQAAQRQLEQDGRRMQELFRILDAAGAAPTSDQDTAYRQAAQDAVAKCSAQLLRSMIDSAMAARAAAAPTRTTQ